jgi:phospholipid-translocating ATPase
MAVAFTQLMANALCSFSGGSLLDTYSLTTYNLLYTALPGLALALDQDRRAEQVLRTPSLYSESASLQWLSTPLFLSWCLRAAYQAFSVLLILAGFALFPSGARDGSTLDVSAADAAVFSALILVQLITVATEMSFPTPYNHLINSGCLLLHVSIMLIRNVWSGIGDSAMGTVSASSPMFPLTVLLAAVVATVPFIAERAWRMNSSEAMRASLSPTHAPREYCSREQDRDSDSLLSPFQSPEPPGSASKTMRTSNSLSRMV